MHYNLLASYGLKVECEILILERNSISDLSIKQCIKHDD